MKSRISSFFFNVHDYTNMFYAHFHSALLSVFFQSELLSSVIPTFSFYFRIVVLYNSYENLRSLMVFTNPTCFFLYIRASTYVNVFDSVMRRILRYAYVRSSQVIFIYSYVVMPCKSRINACFGFEPISKVQSRSNNKLSLLLLLFCIHRYYLVVLSVFIGE